MSPSVVCRVVLQLVFAVRLVYLMADSKEIRNLRPVSACPVSLGTALTSKTRSLAAYAVISAWSYGGETSTMSAPIYIGVSAVRRQGCLLSLLSPS
jgi:hypothetical protein